jgi:hypothetical protein
MFTQRSLAMSILDYLALVTVAGCAVPVAIVWLVQRGKRERARLAALREGAPLLARLEAAERRIAALEAIATDPAVKLARSIDSLAA